MRAVFVFLLLFSRAAFPAACCGGNNLFPSLISGDDRTQLTATTSFGSVVADAPVAGAAVARAAGDAETRATFRLDFATLLSDRWQTGLSLPLVRRFRSRNGTQVEAMGPGDVSWMLGFEALPQWSYSPWQPKGLLFASVTAPTGRSPQDAQSLYQIDSMGRGYWSFSIGGLLQKTWGAWDALLLAEAHQPLARTFSSDVGDFILTPSPGASFAAGVGYSWNQLRLGGTFSALYEGAVRTQGLVDEVGNPALAFPLTLQAAYLVADGWSLGALYTDNSVLGATNLPLSRSLSVLVQARWDR